MTVLWQERTHGVQRRQEYTNRMVAYLFLGVVIVTSVLAAAYLSLAAANVRLADEVWQMEEDLMEQQRVNQALMVEIAQYSSIPALQQRAIAAGYAPASQVHFLEVEGP